MTLLLIDTDISLMDKDVSLTEKDVSVNWTNVFVPYPMEKSHSFILFSVLIYWINVFSIGETVQIDLSIRILPFFFFNWTIVFDLKKMEKDIFVLGEKGQRHFSNVK